jgi:SAM-dependent MidA family methyltransferase
VRERLAQGFGAAPTDPAAYAGEIGEQAEAWVAQAAQRLVRGAMLLIDYGFARREFFHAQRAMGTLMCHYRHHAHGDPFHLPGLQDITAHVDFTAVAQAATAAGLQLLGHVSQARLLTSLGLLEDLAQRHRSAGADPDPLAWARQAQAAQALLSEAEMGELFKAVAFGRGITGPADGFARGDRSAELLE